jgi:hypothetical protein
MILEEQLSNFQVSDRFRGKGPLSVALVVTDHARRLGLPLNPETLLTAQGGQVLGLGKAAVQKILARHNVTRVLAEEAGRTSRGSINKMRSYVGLLNTLNLSIGPLDVDAIERFWISQVNAFFAGKPFKLRLDSSLGLRAVVRSLLAQAEDRQKASSGTMYHGTMMQHLVGAKLELVLGAETVTHNGSNTNDQSPDRTGDFDLGDVSIHVSSAPGEALIRKCAENLDAGRRPVIVTSRKGSTLAEGLAENAGILDRVDVIEFEQFIATNIHELARFEQSRRRIKIGELVEIYNRIVEEYETDPSLQIELSTGKSA